MGEWTHRINNLGGLKKNFGVEKNGEDDEVTILYHFQFGDFCDI